MCIGLKEVDLISSAKGCLLPHDPIPTKAKPTSPNARKEVEKLNVFPERYVSPIASSQPGMAMAKVIL